MRTKKQEGGRMIKVRMDYGKASYEN